MKQLLGIVTARAVPILILGAILTALIPLTFLKFSEANAQSVSSGGLAAPALSVASTSSASVGLSWTAVTGAARYELWTWTSAGGWQRLEDGALTGTTFRHTGLSSGTTQYYWIRAVNGSGGTSDWSERVSATTGETPSEAVPTPTATVSALSKPVLTAVGGAGAVALSWTHVSGAVRYELWAWQDSASGWRRLDDGSLTGTSYTHSGPIAGTTYYYAVRAVNASSEASEWSEFASATVSDSALATQSPTATQTPTASAQTGPTTTATPTATSTVTGSVLSKPVLTAEAGASAIKLGWEVVSGAARYVLWMWRDSASGWQRLDDGNLTGTTFTHSGVTPGTTYYYALRAVDAHGATSELSEYAYATVTDDSTPTATATPAVMATPTITPTPTVTPTVATTQRGALIALYEATDGDNWAHSDNWLTDAPLDSWYGVTADRLGRVDRLRLRGIGLNGKIPDLSALEDLTILGLAFNSFPGPFPDLSALTTNLSHLDLQGNELTGPIPDLSAFSKMRYLTLGHNRLTGPIPDRDALPNLISLYLNNNRLTGTIPPGLGELLNLQLLYLSGNSLSGCIPDSLRFARSNDLDRVGLPYCPAPTPTPGPIPTPATTERGALIALYEATGGAQLAEQIPLADSTAAFPSGTASLPTAAAA